MPPSLRRPRKDPDRPAAEAPVSGTGSAVTEDTRPEAPPIAPDPAGRDGSPAPSTSRRPERRRTLAHATPVLLLRAAHPRVGALTAAGLAIAAAIAGRPGREVGLVLATVLVGQTLLGWFNDLVDRRRDARRLPSGKPMADGYLDPGTTWFVFVCGLLLVVPLAIANGVVAGCAYLGSLALGLLGNVVLRTGWFSWVTWAAAYALFPAFLSYGGWGGRAEGSAPEVAMVVVAALLGVGVHVLCALPGLVADHEDGYRHLPLRIALRIGAPRLLVIALAWTVLSLVGLLVVGDAVGLAH